MFMDLIKSPKEKMATVIGIFEDHYQKYKPLPVVKPELNLDDLHIYRIQLKYVLKRGKK